MIHLKFGCTNMKFQKLPFVASLATPFIRMMHAARNEEENPTKMFNFSNNSVKIYWEKSRTTKVYKL